MLAVQQFNITDMKIRKLIIALALAALAMPAFASEITSDFIDPDTGLKVTRQAYGASVEWKYAEGKLAGKLSLKESFEDGKLASKTHYFYNAEGRRTRSVTEYEDGRKLVNTDYTEGKAVGSIKTREEFSHGKLTNVEAFFYDADGKQTSHATLMSKSEAAKGYLSRMKVHRQAGSVMHSIFYKDDVLDDSNEMVIPDPLPPIPATSGYNEKTITITTEFSENDGGLNVTLKNISNTPVEVHKSELDSPLISIERNVPDGEGSRIWQIAMEDLQTLLGKGKPTVTTIAPGETLRYTATLEKIFERFHDDYGKNKDKPPSARSLGNADPKAELSVVNISYRDLFPLPPNTKRVGTSVGGRVCLGKLGKLKARHPELFKSPDTSETTEASHIEKSRQPN